ncbi:MAG: hypothetical protein ACOCP8_02975 [archaeon]
MKYSTFTKDYNTGNKINVGDIVYNSETGNENAIIFGPVDNTHTHTIMKDPNDYFTTTHDNSNWTDYTNDFTLASAKDVEKLNQTLDYMMKFLIFKGIINNEQEFKDFVDSIKLANKMSEK